MKKFIVIALYFAAFITLYTGIVTAANDQWSDSGIIALLSSIPKSVALLSMVIVVKAADKYIRKNQKD